MVPNEDLSRCAMADKPGLRTRLCGKDRRHIDRMRNHVKHRHPTAPHRGGRVRLQWRTTPTQPRRRRTGADPARCPAVNCRLRNTMFHVVSPSPGCTPPECLPAHARVCVSQRASTGPRQPSKSHVLRASRNRATPCITSSITENLRWTHLVAAGSDSAVCLGHEVAPRGHSGPFRCALPIATAIVTYAHDISYHISHT